MEKENSKLKPALLHLKFDIVPRQLFIETSTKIFKSLRQIHKKNILGW